MAVSSVGLRLKCDCSGKAQKQLYSKLQTRFLVREDALKAERRNCLTKEEEQDKIWSRIPKVGPIPRRTGRLTVGRKKHSNSKKAIRANIEATQQLLVCLPSLYCVTGHPELLQVTEFEPRPVIPDTYDTHVHYARYVELH
jgi:hypothetical protein